MKISARNAVDGRVVACRGGKVNTEVEIELRGGDRLVAVVSTESARDLGIAAGTTVVALVKAPWVMVMAGSAGARLSARNSLEGRVASVDLGAVNAEVTITLPGGTEIVAVITRDAATELRLEPGSAAIAVIKASDVVLALPR